MSEDFFNEREHGEAVIEDIRQAVDQGREAENFRWENFAARFVTAVSKASLYVDAGAEYGFYAYLALKHMPPGGEIHLLEPEPVRFELLSRFMAPHGNVFVHRAAVSDSDGELTLYKPRLTVSCTADPAVAQYAGEDIAPVAFTASGVRLDDMFWGREVDVLKMDVEGAEVLAFQAMDDILASGRTRLFVEFHHPYVESLSPGGMERMERQLQRHGYNCFVCQGNDMEPCGIERGRVYLVPSGLEP